MLQSDKGAQFLNSTFQQMLKRHNIHFYTSENEDVSLLYVQEHVALRRRAEGSDRFVQRNAPPFDRHVAERSQREQQRARPIAPVSCEICEKTPLVLQRRRHGSNSGDTSFAVRKRLYCKIVTALIECGVCVPSNYTGFYIKCNLLRNKENIGHQFTGRYQF